MTGLKIELRFSLLPSLACRKYEAMVASPHVPDRPTWRPADSGPEVELLLGCARATVDSQRAARLQTLIAEGLDWEYLLRLADRHGLQPLLHWHLNACCAESIPSAHRDYLRLAFQRVSALNIFLTHELQRLLKLFADQGIEAVPYKGPALAEQLYGNVALRQFSDLDILVHPRDVTNAKEILLAEGYAPLPALTDGQQAVLLRTQCNLPFTREHNRLIVELHWTVSAPNFARPFEAEAFWGSLEDGSLAGTIIKRPATEHLLLSLCIHGSKHLWERLAWISDLAGLIDQNEGLDWQQLIRTARATGNERMLSLGLRLAVDLLGAKLPQEIEETLNNDEMVPALAAGVRRYLFTPEFTPSGVAGYFRFQLKARRRLRDKVKYVRFAFSPTEEDLVRIDLPASLSFIYYLVRPVRLVVAGSPSHFH
ncbi:MAG: nucleotidyltransferase family protein [Acidobacteriota bacterium]